MFLKNTLFSICCILSLSVNAQIAFDRYDSVEVKINGSTLQNPWAGGINYGQFSELDLNLDGTKDMVIFDRTGNKIIPFINHGTPNQVDYKFAPEYISRFPALHDWALFLDYNCDGFNDIFTYSTGGFSVFKNISTPLSGLAFQLSEYIVKSHYSPAPNDFLGLYISRVDIPSFVDVDYDGDLDVLTFDINSGTEIEFHKNMSMETYGVCDSLSNFRLDGTCWGHMTANTTNTVNLNIACKPAPGNAGYDTTALSKNLHIGSSLLALDKDNDRDYDLLLGGISTNDLNMLTNGGDSTMAHISAQESNFPLSNVPVNITIFPAAFYLDVDNDGHKDLIATPNAGNSSENFNSNWWYKNTDTTGACNFAYQTNSFMQNQMIETGEGAYPTFFDYNSDGLKDLVIGNYGYFNISGALSTKLSLYRNIGTATVPKFELITRDYAGLSAYNLLYAAPAFGDVDGDGDKDMMIATNNNAGSILYFENLAGAGNTANFVLSAAGLLTALGQFPSPQIIDVNRDNKPDLLIGMRNGTLSYYQNNTSGSNLQFTLVNPNFGNVNVCSYGAFIGYCTPQLVDEANGYHLYAGNQDGHVFHYTNIDNNLGGAFTLSDTLYRNLSEGDRIAPAISDITADGYYDWVIGNYSGGVTFFKGKFSAVSIAENSVPNGEVLLYPNPVTGNLNLTFINQLPETAKTISIYNSVGELVYIQEIHKNSFSLSTAEWAKGLYSCNITSHQQSLSKKFIVR